MLILVRESKGKSATMRKKILKPLLGIYEGFSSSFYE
jgi:hypothetical protein